MQPSPLKFVEAVNGIQKAAVARAAIELDVFTRLAEGLETVEALAQACACAPRGMRVLLDRRSPHYMGSSVEFQHAASMQNAFLHFTDAVRHGGAVTEPEGTMAPSHPIWVRYARDMMPMALPQARQAALHAGSAFDVDLGTGHDLVLLPNILHHFDRPACEALLRRVHAALRPGGRVFVIELVPHEDRISPSAPAWFAVMMLATTPAGDAYTQAEYSAMLHEARFSSPVAHPLPGSARTLLISFREGR